MRKNIANILLLFLALHCGAIVHAQAEKEGPLPANSGIIRVGIAGSRPFVFDSAADKKGIAIEIWEDIAQKKNWPFQYQYFDGVKPALAAMGNGDLDLVVGSISITSNRLERMRFSQPYYNSSLAIMSRKDKPSLWDKIQPIFSYKLAIAVGIFVFILALVGTLLWLVERKKSEQFPNNAVDGIGTGMWLALVTMTTVGYGDKAPETVWGRVITGSWMVISLIFATSMVAGIASTLTLSSMGHSTIANIENLDGRKAAAVGESPAEEFLQEHDIDIVRVATLAEGAEKLKNREVDAMVYDRPQLLYYLKENKNTKLFIAKAEYYKQGYGFAFPQNSPLVYDVNRTLLELSEDQKIAEIVKEYLNIDK